MNKMFSILVVLMALFALVGIRLFEENIFYDPLIHYFKADYNNEALPDFNSLKLLLNITFRYFLNTVLSLLILWFVFKKAEIVKLSVVIYFALFVVLTATYFYLINTYQTGNYLTLFYVRRFLIQPLFLLVLLPAFYFQKKG